MKKLLVALFTFCSVFTVKSQDHNFILIIADDLGIDAFNGFDLGDIKPTTPHLDSLRQSGLNFTNAWSTPVCTPTRAAIMSGKYGSKNEVKTAPGNLDTTHKSIFRALKEYDNSYTTATFGKWHISKPIDPDHPFYHGADHYMGILGAGWNAYDDWEKTEMGVTTTSNEYATSYFTDDAINWIQNQNNPFMLWLAHIAPHTPFHVPPAHMHSQPSTNSQIKKYMAMIESLDYEVGRLMDSLTPQQRTNTTFIFIGDNGTPSNVLQDYPAGRGKETLYQGGIHVPMFACGNGVTRTGDDNSLLHVLDIYATILELAGQDLPGGIYNSLSFKNKLTQDIGPSRKYNFSELDTNANDITTQGYTIRDEQFKLITYYDGTQEMFDLINDTLELNNLLLGTPSNNTLQLKAELETEADMRINNWSCQDSIQNGDETGIDCGGTFCAPCTQEIESFHTETLKLFPNPASTLITINSNSTLGIITIKDQLGKIIMQEDFKNNSSANMDISDIKPGLYYLNSSNKNSKSSLKFIKTK